MGLQTFLELQHVQHLVLSGILLSWPASVVILLLVWIIRRPSNVIKHLALKNNSQQRRGINLPPVYPNGWIPTAEARDVLSTKPIESIVCGHQVVLFRNSDKQVVCLDAFCPHLGSNLAYGGKIEKHQGQNCIRCPFHGWTFGPDGKCVNVPYTEGGAPPKGVKIRNWKCYELNGFVYVWYHADDEQPNWSLISVDQIQDDRWTYMGRTEHTVSCHFQEIPENGADIAHLNVIHVDSAATGNCFTSRAEWLQKALRKLSNHTWVAEWNPACMNPDKKPSHVNNILLINRTWLFGWQVFQLRLQIQQVGPATVNLVFEADVAGLYKFHGAFIQAVQPLTPTEHSIVHHFYCKDTLLNRFLAKLMLNGEAVMVERDIEMWNRKRFLRNPILMKEERSIVQFRSWFAQFYSESSPTLQSLQNPYDW